MAHLSDTHLLADPGGSIWGHNPAKNLAAVMSALPPRIDVMVVTGDVAEDGTHAAYRIASSLTARRSARRYFIPGNHDDPAVMGSELGQTEDLRMFRLSRSWKMGLLNTQWVGHDAGYVAETTLDRLREHLRRRTTHVMLCLHHPPISPCPHRDCGIVDGGRVVDVLRDSPVRVVLSGHVHQQFETTRDGVTFLGAPSTFRQLRHGSNPHYTDTGEPPAARVLELHGNGDVSHRIVPGQLSGEAGTTYSDP